jgi:glycosyltransferase involved in cell wall biosynthesis
MTDLQVPTVSVVMGVYNGESHLEKGLNSILDQTFTDFEFIIINDGSTDKTGEILDEAANRDSRVKVFHCENVGLTKSLIHGCELARGKYIARQDADDYSYPDRFELQVQYLQENPEIVLVSSWANITGPGGELLIEDQRLLEPDEATRLLLEEFYGPPGHGSVMFRREVYEQVGGYRSAFYYAQDFDLWLRLGCQGKFAYIPKTLYSYEVAPTSISGGLHGAKLAYYELVKTCHEARSQGKSDAEKIQEFVERHGNRPPHEAQTSFQKRKSSFRTHYFIGRCLKKRGDRRARHYFAESVRDYPFSILAWGNLIVSSLSMSSRSDYS